MLLYLDRSAVPSHVDYIDGSDRGPHAAEPGFWHPPKSATNKTQRHGTVGGMPLPTFRCLPEFAYR